MFKCRNLELMRFTKRYSDLSESIAQFKNEKYFIKLRSLAKKN